MKLSQFDFDLPRKLIAQKPVSPRDSSKLMVVLDDGYEIVEFREIVRFLKKGDVLVVNSTKVIPARVNFRFEGKVAEILVVERVGSDVALVMGKPGKMFKFWKVVKVSNEVSFELLEKLENGLMKIRFFGGENFEVMNWIEKQGELPLPPYVRNFSGLFERYQTVFARNKGSIAAPTAGLHFTKQLLYKLKSLGVKVIEVELKVGIGTFKPIKVDNVLEHKMHEEEFELGSLEAKCLNKAKKNGNRIIAVGTTTLRVLESCFDNKYGIFWPKSGKTGIFIYPGKNISSVDGLITNFHLPKSTLLVLVSAILGVKRTLWLYGEAVRRRMRFYSFGDAMFFLNKNK